MHIQLVGYAWAFLVLGTDALTKGQLAMIGTRCKDQGLLKSMVNGAKNMVFGEPCPEQAALPCPQAFAIAEGCDKSIYTDLIFRKHGNFGQCFIKEYKKVAFIDGKPTACAQEFEYYGCRPYLYLANPKHRHTQGYYTNQGWPKLRPECSQKKPQAQNPQSPQSGITGNNKQEKVAQALPQASPQQAQARAQQQRPQAQGQGRIQRETLAQGQPQPETLQALQPVRNSGAPLSA